MDGFTYEIKDWDKNFFIKRDALKNRAGKPPWISVRTNHDGYAIRQISVSPGATEAYGAFILIAAVVAKTDTEHGRLIDDGHVLAPERLAVRTGFPAASFARAAVVLERVGWLERIKLPDGAKGTFGSDSPERAQIYDELAREWRTHKPLLQHPLAEDAEPGPDDTARIPPDGSRTIAELRKRTFKGLAEIGPIPPGTIGPAQVHSGDTPETRRKDAGGTPEPRRKDAGQSAAHDTNGTDVTERVRHTNGTYTTEEKDEHPQTPLQGASLCFYCAISEEEAGGRLFAVNVISQDTPGKRFPICDACHHISRGHTFSTDTEFRQHIHWTLWTSGRARYVDAREKRFGGKKPTGTCPSTVRPGTGPLGGAPEVTGDPLFDAIKATCFGSGTDPSDQRRIKKALTSLKPKGATAEQIADRFARLKRTHPERLPTLEILVKQWDALAPQGPTLDWEGV